jgi:hypothetical protein
MYWRSNDEGATNNNERIPVWIVNKDDYTIVRKTFFPFNTISDCNSLFLSTIPVTHFNSGVLVRTETVDPKSLAPGTDPVDLEIIVYFYNVHYPYYVLSIGELDPNQRCAGYIEHCNEIYFNVTWTEQDPFVPCPTSPVVHSRDVTGYIIGEYFNSVIPKNDLIKEKYQLTGFQITIDIGNYYVGL